MGGGWLDGLGGGWFDPGSAGTDPVGGARTFGMRADRPMVAEDIIRPNSNPGYYPPGAWDSDLLSLTFLPEFVVNAKGPAGEPWESYLISQIGNPPTVTVSGPAPAGNDSIDEMRRLAVTQRPEAMIEILSESKNMQLAFLHLIMMTQNSHPRTYFLLKVVARVGEMVMLRLKAHFNRPRPGQYFATLYPPIAVPGHASYPAGHALLPNLTASCLTEAMRNKTTGISPHEEALWKLADNMGMNRVYAGLHFVSDITAGAQAGKLTHDMLMRMPKPSPGPDWPKFNYSILLKAAQDEWQ